MADNARGIHVSPGIYTKETDITYAVKSLGITTLGLVGETQKGPAFQPMLIENWKEFKSTFGGTSTEKFQGSQYPKYELPYVAKSYLSESNQLQVCRVLGLSGYNAGPAWVIKAVLKGSTQFVPVAVLRSRGHYEKYHKYATTTGTCDCLSESYDTLFYTVGEVSASTSNFCKAPKLYNMDAVKLTAYTEYASDGSECAGYKASGTTLTFNVTSTNYGQFKIIGIKGEHAKGTSPSSGDTGYFEYPVSLNPSAKDYILKVLGTSPSDGDAPLYVESLYDVVLQQLVLEGKVEEISSELEAYDVYHVSDYNSLESVYGIIEKQEESLTKKDVGKRFLADASAVANKIHSHEYKNGKPVFITVEESGSTVESPKVVEVGQIYTVAQYTTESGKRKYYYKFVTDENDKLIDGSKFTGSTISTIDYTDKGRVLVLNNTDNRYYRLYGTDVTPVTCDMNNYRDTYRYASTPWIVSNVKGDATKIELNKLFRFHTISDGNTANQEIKISIQNIKTDDGTFEVAVRDINDTDASPVYLERFTKCTLTPGDSTYIAYKIGSFDGVYESKSKYITVEVNENTSARNSSPSGFLGYPLSQFAGVEVLSADNHSDMTQPVLKYNLDYDEDVKNRKQYFGLSDRVGVDIDMFTYKGHAAYGDEPEFLTQGFHLDSRLDLSSYDKAPKLTVDGEEGYTFDSVSTQNRTLTLDESPIIGTEAEMVGSIYEYVDLRKFTVYFYGGFDGWDEYRDYRSNTDDFKLSKYRGQYNEENGEGLSFNAIDDYEPLKLNQKGLTSDWYAYLSGIRQFANPEEVDINVFATPGIDILNNQLLVEEAIEMIEEERADSIYVVTLPDKPFGAADYVDEMYTADDVVYALEDTEIDSNYTCTYYPWVKYEDTDNNQYIYLPPTKDVVRNMAMTDNTAYPWFAPAGITRGDVTCARAHVVTKLADEDVLYEGRINPIKTFASDGVKIWGQKNLQVADSQLNRINVRRLLLRLRKLIAISCLGLIFEQNDATTKNKFLSTVTPILDNIKANRGITDYKIEVENSVEAREKHELNVSLFIKPSQVLEYLTIDFIVTPEGVSFDDI